MLVLEQMLAEAERLGVLADPAMYGHLPAAASLRIFYMYRASWERRTLQGLAQPERERRQRQLLLLSSLLISHRRCASGWAGAPGGARRRPAGTAGTAGPARPRPAPKPTHPTPPHPTPQVWPR
jgi:hypothetical protein